jgi:hypothetical protein
MIYPQLKTNLLEYSRRITLTVVQHDDPWHEKTGNGDSRYDGIPAFKVTGISIMAIRM